GRGFRASDCGASETGKARLRARAETGQTWQPSYSRPTLPNCPAKLLISQPDKIVTRDNYCDPRDTNNIWDSALYRHYLFFTSHSREFHPETRRHALQRKPFQFLRNIKQNSETDSVARKPRRKPYH